MFTTAAEIAVPLPFKTPVTLVVRVMAGVLVAVATVPAKPLADTTETLVTVPLVAGAASAARGECGDFLAAGRRSGGTRGVGATV